MVFNWNVSLPEGKSHKIQESPIKPPFSYGFPIEIGSLLKSVNFRSRCSLTRGYPEKDLRRLSWGRVRCTSPDSENCWLYLIPLEFGQVCKCIDKHQPFYLTTYLPINLSIHLLTYLSTYLSIYLAIYLSIYLSIYPNKQIIYVHICIYIYTYIYV